MERFLNYSVVGALKKYYNYRCQICGKQFFETYSVNISEAHHIVPFVESQNNNADNLIVLCPNHHRIIHTANPLFNREQKVFTYTNALVEPLMVNDHL
jgi:predicted restriction endonuclease